MFPAEKLYYNTLVKFRFEYYEKCSATLKKNSLKIG